MSNSRDVQSRNEHSNNYIGVNQRRFSWYTVITKFLLTCGVGVGESLNMYIVSIHNFVLYIHFACESTVVTKQRFHVRNDLFVVRCIT